MHTEYVEELRKLKTDAGNFAASRLNNLEKSRYLKKLLAEYDTDNIEVLPEAVQLALEREAAYLQGFMEGIQFCGMQKSAEKNSAQINGHCVKDEY